MDEYTDNQPEEKEKELNESKTNENQLYDFMLDMTDDMGQPVFNPEWLKENF